MKIKEKIGLFAIVNISILLIVLPNFAMAAWTPGSSEIAPIKDTYVSIDGSLSKPESNFGGSDQLTVGDGFDGHCITAIQFDLSSLPSNVLSLNFISHVTVYGEETRKMKVYIMLNIDWDELSVTGLDNPFNATDIYLDDSSNANVTTLTIVGSTNELDINITQWKSYSKVTLLFAMDPEVTSWMTMQSKENSYLTSYSNPPHLKYTLIPTSDPPSGGSDPSSSSGTIIFLIIVIGIVVFVVKKKRV